MQVGDIVSWHVGYFQDVCLGHKEAEVAAVDGCWVVVKVVSTEKRSSIYPSFAVFHRDRLQIVNNVVSLAA